MSDNKPTLLLDMDGIIADFNRHSIRVYNDLYHTQYDEAKCNTYIGDHEVLEPTIDSKKLRAQYKKSGFFINIPIIKGAKEGVTALEEHFDIHILTTHYYSNPTCVAEKESWLARHFPSIADSSIFTKHKYLIPGRYFIDDRPTNCQKWLERWRSKEPSTATLLLPWSNQKYQHILSPDWGNLASEIIREYNEQQES